MHLYALVVLLPVVDLKRLDSSFEEFFLFLLELKPDILVNQVAQTDATLN